MITKKELCSAIIHFDWAIQKIRGQTDSTNPILALGDEGGRQAIADILVALDPKNDKLVGELTTDELGRVVVAVIRALRPFVEG